VAALDEINLLGDIIIATIHNNTVCKKDATVAGTRIIQYLPLKQISPDEKIAAKHRPVITLAPLKLKNIGLIITGSEVLRANQRWFFPDSA